MVWCLSSGATFLYLGVINENNMRGYSGNRNEDSSIIARNMKLFVARGGGVVLYVSSDIVRDTSLLSKPHVFKTQLT